MMFQALKYQEDYELALQGFHRAKTLDPTWNEPGEEETKLKSYLSRLQTLVYAKVNYVKFLGWSCFSILLEIYHFIVDKSTITVSIIGPRIKWDKMSWSKCCHYIKKKVISPLSSHCIWGLPEQPTSKFYELSLHFDIQDIFIKEIFYISGRTL